MKFESQVCSLTPSQQLKSLGVKQESVFYWVARRDSTFELVSYETCRRALANMKSQYTEAELNWESSYFSAFTVAELGEMLPWEFSVDTWKQKLSIFKEEQFWVCSYETQGDGMWPNKYSYWEKAATEADARAKMLVYLIENKLISVPGCLNKPF